MRASRPLSALARWLEPFASGLWVLFFLWSAAVAILWLRQVGDVELASSVGNRDLRSALAFFLGALDGGWIFLAAANVHLSLASDEGVPAARRWAIAVFGLVWIAAAASSASGLPFGAIRYTGRLGPLLGAVPVAIPLLWLAVILGSRAAARSLLPGAGYPALAALAGVLSLATDLNLEPVARKLRAWWIWNPGSLGETVWPPAGNFITWLLLPAALTYFLRETPGAPKVISPRRRPAVVLLTLNALFLCGRLAMR